MLLCVGDHGNIKHAAMQKFDHKTFFSNKLKFNFCAIYDGNAASDPVYPFSAVMTVKNYAAISVFQWRLLFVGREYSDLYHKRHESPVIQNEEEALI